MFAQSLRGSAHIAPRRPRPRPAAAPHPRVPLPIPAPCSPSPLPLLASGCSCTQRGSVPVLRPAAGRCPAGGQKLCLCRRPGPAQARGLARTAQGNLPPSSASAGWGARARGGVGSSKAPIERSPASPRQMGKLFAAGALPAPTPSPPYVTIRLRHQSGGKEGKKEKKINI